ncbi:pentatricopeptide repeat-containing protein At5g66520-like [Coffea eugenioides]|uniref:Pentatricopeptide repeat-containing protein At5g66520-like n=1 Tax=Coffea arabica TaxID=13443 RepID=A0A6P6THS8_COFAR|nr:pentatricopeptide repeat-containing protein At5g66520-like [Coffea arabica]XP_027078050.1 pentatricopeptide repeat-containing protein At5g66520-like [Coffea arabica]XP_027179770.1 pentatricopeptide repeat-containing protein At5g66520-like [Coffea eugenioides]XP_027179771.1 pentatricopeptide repeat-containing protein At5g66520-like [Coffea eugenioides]
MVSHFASKYLKSSYKAISLLDQPCLSLSQLKQIQCHLIVSGTIADPFAAGKLLSRFGISEKSDLSHAYALFRLIPNRSPFIWNTIIRAFTEHSQLNGAILLSKEMLGNGFWYNNYTFSFVFRACSELKDVSLGLMYHTHVIKLGWEVYDFVQNGLIHFYATCDCMDIARKLFDASKTRDVITWTAVINGYVKRGNIGFAKELFDQMPEKNAVSWSTMINGHVQSGLFLEALEMFDDMQVAGIGPNHAAIVGALSACAFLGALDQGTWIHAYMKRNKIELDRALGTALVDMYAKCGCIEMACHVFEEIPRKDVLAYTSFISGLANHGESARAMEVFNRMESEGVGPNEVTFICVLNACSRMGLVEEGLRIFESIKGVYGMEPVVQHYGCLVDLLGRAGMLEQARKVVKEMPVKPDSYVLGALLNACRVHSDIDLGKEMVKGLADQSLDHGGVHVLLSNIYAAINKWDDAESVRKVMDEKKVKKVPGCSMIDLDGMTCEFVAGDRSRVNMDEISFCSLVVDSHLKSLGYDEYEISLE